jgi:hypothetical protein
VGAHAAEEVTVGQPTERRGGDRQVRFGRILGLFFSLAGFTTIALGWNGSAKSAFVDVQFPYLISGGVTGLALIVLGVGLLVMAQIRSERIHLTDELAGVGRAVSRSTAVQSSAGTNGGRVVAGPSTYHRPDCRLVAGKTDVDLISIAAAKAGGLTPCRVCGPEESDAAEPAKGAGDTTTS